MTPHMELRWFWTIGAVCLFAIVVIFPDLSIRLSAVTITVLFIVQTTLAWRDYLEWRIFWDKEQQKGMPE